MFSSEQPDNSEQRGVRRGGYMYRWGRAEFPSENADFAQIAIRRGIQSDWCPHQPGGRDPGVPLKCITLTQEKKEGGRDFFLFNRDSYHRVLLCIRRFYNKSMVQIP